MSHHWPHETGHALSTREKVPCGRGGGVSQTATPENLNADYFPYFSQVHEGLFPLFKKVKNKQKGTNTPSGISEVHFQIVTPRIPLKESFFVSFNFSLRDISKFYRKDKERTAMQ